MAALTTCADKLSWIIFVFSVCFCTFLFMLPGQWPRHVLIGLTLISVLLTSKEARKSHQLLELWEFFKPWIPWFIGLTILSLYHGLDGFSRYFNALAIPILLFISLKRIQIDREFLLTLLACVSFIFSICICLDIYKSGGVQTNILGINKNILIPLNTLSNVACFISIFVYRHYLQKRTLALLLVNSIAALTVLVIAETRTVLLAYISIFPIILIHAKNNRKKYALIFIGLLLLLISLFFVTGRMQEGITDLKLYESGNSNSSWGIRLALWSGALESFQKFPLFGVGPHFQIANLSANLPSYTHNVLHLHSDYFQFLTIGGLVGLISWLFTCFALIRKALTDPCRLAIILASLAMGLTEKFWNYWASLMALVVILTLFYVSNISKEKDFSEHQV